MTFNLVVKTQRHKMTFNVFSGSYWTNCNHTRYGIVFIATDYNTWSLFLNFSTYTRIKIDDYNISTFWSIAVNRIDHWNSSFPTGGSSGKPSPTSINSLFSKAALNKLGRFLMKVILSSSPFTAMYSTFSAIPNLAGIVKTIAFPCRLVFILYSSSVYCSTSVQ
ncbi:hypothetical protein RV09_GL002444 [Enterococcus moraviensis]|nr:hypothetical protein RV09_GL002444 [Enterococcus moraviensis]